MLELKAFSNKVRPFVIYYDKLINSYNNTGHNSLEKEIKLLLPQVKRKQKHGIITTLVSSFVGLAYEGISSFLQHKQNNALHKAVNAMNDKVNIQHNKLMKLDGAMLMYGIYNAKMLQKLIKTIHKCITQHFPMRNYLQVNIIIPYLEYFMHTLSVYNTIPPIHFYI